MGVKNKETKKQAGNEHKAVRLWKMKESEKDSEGVKRIQKE